MKTRPALWALAASSVTLELRSASDQGGNWEGWEWSLPEAGCATSLESQESLILEEERAKGNLEWNDGN